MTPSQLSRTDTPSIIVDSRAAVTRREVGVLAWSVLEEVALAAGAEGKGAFAAAVDARSVAQKLGVGKDTAARGLARLVSVGLLRRTVGRDPSGRFGVSRYHLELPEGVRVAAPSTVSEKSGTGGAGHGVRRAGRAKQSAASAQLSLLGAASRRHR
jgi:hypothetical protein